MSETDDFYKNLDFENALPVNEVPELLALQEKAKQLGHLTLTPDLFIRIKQKAE